MMSLFAHRNLSPIQIAQTLLHGHQEFVTRNTGLTLDARVQHFAQNTDYLLSNNRHFIADTMAEYQPNGDATSEGQALHAIGYALAHLATGRPDYLENAVLAWDAYIQYLYARQVIPETPCRFICNWIGNGKEPTLADYPIHPTIPTQGGYKCVPLQFVNGLAQIPHGAPYWGEYLDVATYAHRGHMTWYAINATVQKIQEHQDGLIDWNEVYANYRASDPAEPWMPLAWIDWDGYLVSELGYPAGKAYTVQWGGPDAKDVTHEVSWLTTWVGTSIGIGPGPDDQLWHGEILEENLPLAERGKVQLADTSINGVYLLNYAVRLPVEHGGYRFQRGELWHNRPVNTPLHNAPNQYGNAADGEVWFIEACYLLWRITGEARYKQALDCAFYTAHEYTYIDRMDKFFRQSTQADTPFTDGISYDFRYPETLPVAYGRDEQGYISVAVGGEGQHFMEQQAIWYRINADESAVTQNRPLAYASITWAGKLDAGSATVGCKLYLDIQPIKKEAATPSWYVLALPKLASLTPQTYEFPIYSFAQEVDGNGDAYLVADSRAVTEWGTVTWQEAFEDDVLDGRSATVINAWFPDSGGGFIIGFWLLPSLRSVMSSIVYRASHPVDIRIVDDDGWRWYWLLPATVGEWVNFTLAPANLILSGYQPDHPSDPPPSAPNFTDLDQIEVQLENSGDTNVDFSYYCVNTPPPLYTSDDGWVMTYRMVFSGESAYSLKIGDCYIRDGRLDSLAYTPGTIPFSNIYNEGTYQIGNWHGMPYPGYQWPAMYCMQDDDRYGWWLENQVNLLRDSQLAYYHQTGELGPGCAAYVWNRSDNYKYGGVVPTPYFGSTFGNASGFGPTFTYRCASPVRLFVADQGGALWEFQLPAAADWSTVTPSGPTLYSGTPSGSLVWSTEPLRIISEAPFWLRLGDDIEFPQCLYDYHTTYHWGDGKPWGGYQPRAFNAAARAWYELVIRGKAVPAKLRAYVEDWLAWLVEFMEATGGISPSDFPVAPATAQPDPTDFTGHMCGLWLAGTSYALLCGTEIPGAERLADRLLAELARQMDITPYPGHAMNGSWSPDLRLGTDNGMHFGFYTGEIFRGLSVYLLFKRHGAGFDMFARTALPSHEATAMDWTFAHEAPRPDNPPGLEIDFTANTATMIRNGAVVDIPVGEVFSAPELPLDYHWFMQGAGTFVVEHSVPAGNVVLSLLGFDLLSAGPGVLKLVYDYYKTTVVIGGTQKSYPRIVFDPAQAAVLSIPAVGSVGKLSYYAAEQADGLEASLSLNFLEQGYAMGVSGQRPTGRAFADLITFSRSTTGTRFNHLGLLETVAADQPRFDHAPATLTTSSSSVTIGHGSKTFAVSRQYTVGETVRATADSSNWMVGKVTAATASSVTITVVRGFAGSGTHSSWTLIVVLGLLVEEQRTNLLTYSDQFDNAVWTKTGTCVVTADQTAAPDGTTAGDLVAGAIDITAGAGGNNVSRVMTVTASVPCTSSVWVKAGTATTVSLRHRSGSGASLGSKAFALTPSWQRVSLTTTQDANTALTLLIGASDGTFYIWGAQLEVGAFPTSYVPTSGAQVTRSADVAKVTSLSPWYNASEGTVFAEWTTLSLVAGERGPVWFNNGTINRGIGIRYRDAGASLQGSWRAPDNTVLHAPSITAPTAGNVVRAGFSFSAASVSLAVNGGAATNVTGSVSQTAVDNLWLGYCEVSGSNRGYMNGHIRSLDYYPSRLSNADLQALTAA